MSQESIIAARKRLEAAIEEIMRAKVSVGFDKEEYLRKDIQTGGFLGLLDQARDPKSGERLSPHLKTQQVSLLSLYSSNLLSLGEA